MQLICATIFAEILTNLSRCTEGSRNSAPRTTNNTTTKHTRRFSKIRFSCRVIHSYTRNCQNASGHNSLTVERCYINGYKSKEVYYTGTRDTNKPSRVAKSDCRACRRRNPTQRCDQTLSSVQLPTRRILPTILTSSASLRY